MNCFVRTASKNSDRANSILIKEDVVGWQSVSTARDYTYIIMCTEGFIWALRCRSFCVLVQQVFLHEPVFSSTNEFQELGTFMVTRAQLTSTQCKCYVYVTNFPPCMLLGGWCSSRKQPREAAYIEWQCPTTSIAIVPLIVTTHCLSLL